MSVIVNRSVRYRVPPRPLPRVRPLHVDGVFGNFDDITDHAITRLDASGGKMAAEKARFFRYLKGRVDAEKFGEMQEFQLAEGRVRMDSDMVKYLDPIYWFESKVEQALALGLDQRAPIDILDIGTGPVHFPVVAEFYGHRVLGTDLPYRTTGKLERGHIYDSLAEIYGIRRIPQKVLPFTPLPELDQRYHLVTAFLAAFNLMEDKSPWTVEAWRYFLADLRDNVLTEDGELFMTLDRNKLTEETWGYLRSLSDAYDDHYKRVRISNFTGVNGTT